MDVATDLPVSTEDMTALSYDDTVVYEEQVAVPGTEEADPRVADHSLANRIGRSKVYLLSETTAAARGVLKWRHEDEVIVFDPDKRIKEDDEEPMEDDTDSDIRSNAILLQGSPISHLPTARLFAYAKHFDTNPLGLEWVNDNTCVLVFPSKSNARTAFQALQKYTEEVPDAESFLTAKPIPIALWPPEERINSSLGKGGGLKGVLKMRWARKDDVKKKGAKRESEFYRRHGEDAGKELFNGRELPPTKRARHDTVDSESRTESIFDETMERKRLDNELDQFLAEDDVEQEEVAPPSPPSKMRSDYIASDGRTLLDRFSDSTPLFESDRNPAERVGLKERLILPLPRRARGPKGTQKREWDRGKNSLSDRLWPDETEDGNLGGRRESKREGRRRGGRGNDRPKKTQQELDDELDAFLREE